MVSSETLICGMLTRLPRPWRRGCYRLAYWTLRLWWLLRRPQGHGAGIAIWHAGKILLIRTSYRHLLDVPGGGLEPGEAVMTAALRELWEEVGIKIEPGELGHPETSHFHFEHRAITSTVFSAALNHAPEPRIDHAEIVWAGYVDPSMLARADLAPGLLAYLDRRTSKM